ncbi:MAG: hypothetical protein HY763_14160 [Planctomycetes bacterium]|nr:hypothetical protein [Planctomycetota bacterium]
MNVTGVGFPTLPSGDVVRNGQWTPIVVDLALLDEAAFDGVLRVSQLDNDGDACYDRVEVHLRRDSGGHQRSYLYALANPRRAENKFAVELIDIQGAPVQVVSQGELTYRAEPPQQPSVISDDDILVLSVSTSSVGRVKDLLDARDVEQRESFSRAVHVGHISPSELPEHWIGLEGVDFLVWDEALADDATDRQREALIEWVRQGGTLLLAASRTASSLVLHESLYAILPAQIGEVTAVANLPELRGGWLGAPYRAHAERGEGVEWHEMPFPAPVPLARSSARAGAAVIARDRATNSDVLTRWRVDRGSVMFSGVTLKDLFSAPGGAVEFFQATFYLAPAEKADAAQAPPLSLFNQIVGAVSYATSGSLYLLIATLASVGYVALATFGSWGFLGARGWRHHSWSAFALVACLASALSMVAVNFLQGFGERLHQLTIVDAEAGSGLGYATALFGLKTSADKRLDVWLPTDRLAANEPQVTPCFLRPVPGENEALSTATTYADPSAYRVSPTVGVVEEVRCRATLKQLEGRWKGPLGGKLSASVRVQRGRITEDSFVINALGVALRDCILLHARVNLADNARTRSDLIFAYRIGDLPADGARVPLAPLCYQPAPGESLGEFLMRSQLSDAQEEWKKGVSVLNVGRSQSSRYGQGDERNALLLMSTIGEFAPQNFAGMLDPWMGMRALARDRLRRLDLREQIDAGRPASESSPGEPGSMVLIGFAADPGPARLFLREGDRPFRALEPERRHSWAMYRIRIPVTVMDQAPADDGGEEEPATESGS